MKNSDINNWNVALTKSMYCEAVSNAKGVELHDVCTVLRLIATGTIESPNSICHGKERSQYNFNTSMACCFCDVST